MWWCKSLIKEAFSKPSLHNTSSSMGIGRRSRGVRGLNPYTTSKGEGDLETHLQIPLPNFPNS